MIGTLARLAPRLVLIAVLTALFSVVDISSKALAPQLQAREESHAWGDITIALGVAGLAAYGGPQSTLHSAWAGGSLVVYPGGIGQGVEFYVDSVNGTTGAGGLSWKDAVPTIQAAVDKCTSNQGDRVFIAGAPTAYAENVTITNKHLLSLVGVYAAGWGRPDIVPATGKALAIDNSHGTVLEHLRLSSTNDSDGVTNEGNGFLFNDCVFDGTSAQGATRANLRLVGDATSSSYTASEGLIVNCLIRGSGGIGLAFQHANAPSGVGVSDVEVRKTRFYGNTGADIATVAGASGGGAGIVSNLLIEKNKFMTFRKTTYLDMDQASFAGGDLLLNTGMIAANYFADDAALNATKIDISGTSMSFVGNFNAIGIVDGSTFEN